MLSKVTLGLLATMIGCSHLPEATQRATLAQLERRATFDLDCPPTWMRLHEIDTRTKGVEGCGRRLAYIEVCESRRSVAVCTWVLDATPGTHDPADSRTPWARPFAERR